MSKGKEFKKVLPAANLPMFPNLNVRYLPIDSAFTGRFGQALRPVAISFYPFVIGIARATYLAGFNRDQERDADRAGQALAAASGYDPRAMAEFLRKLEYSERLELGASRIPSFFDTHPSTVERAGTTYDRGSSLSFTKHPGIAGDAAEFVKRLE